MVKWLEPGCYNVHLKMKIKKKKMLQTLVHNVKNVMENKISLSNIHYITFAMGMEKPYP